MLTTCYLLLSFSMRLPFELNRYIFKIIKLKSEHNQFNNKRMVRKVTKMKFSITYIRKIKPFIIDYYLAWQPVLNYN